MVVKNFGAFSSPKLNPTKIFCRGEWGMLERGVN